MGRGGIFRLDSSVSRYFNAVEQLHLHHLVLRSGDHVDSSSESTVQDSMQVDAMVLEVALPTNRDELE